MQKSYCCKKRLYIFGKKDEEKSKYVIIDNRGRANYKYLNYLWKYLGGKNVII